MPKSSKIRIRQIRSGTGCPMEMRETLKALGLGKMQRVSERKDSPAIRGLIARIPHLVTVVAVEAGDIVFPSGKSTLGRKRIREAIDSVVDADAK
jgi:large subunit ribosomal protein L30